MAGCAGGVSGNPIGGRVLHDGWNVADTFRERPGVAGAGEKIEKWNEFLEDLKGKNEDNCKVDFNNENAEIANQLSTWMDFWNPGNHDDRTLAIIY